MRRHSKRFLALAGILLAAGLVLRGLGFVMGGRGESRQQYHEFWEDLTEDGAARGLLRLGRGERTGLVESGALTGVCSIEAELNCGDLWVQEGEELSVSLSWRGSEYEMRYQVEDGVLKIRDESRGHLGVGGFDMDSKAILTVPAGTALDRLDLSTALGDIEVDAAFSAREASLSTDLGKVTSRGFQAEELEAESDLGDVELHLPGSREEYTWKLETAMGELTEDGEKRSGGLGDVAYQSGSGPNRVEAQTDLGDVALHFSR